MRRRMRVAVGVLTTLLGCSAVLAQRRATGPARPCEAPRIQVYKHQNALDLWCGAALRGRYRATFGANPVGPKLRAGDERTPEGSYRVTSRVATPRFHRFLGVSYPNAEDRRRSAALGVRDPGGGIGIHGVQARRAGAARLWLRLATSTALGQWWGPTDGCVALANEDIEEVYDAVRVGTPVRIDP